MGFPFLYTNLHHAYVFIITLGNICVTPPIITIQERIGMLVYIPCLYANTTANWTISKNLSIQATDEGLYIHNITKYVDNTVIQCTMFNQTYTYMLSIIEPLLTNFNLVYDNGSWHCIAIGNLYSPQMHFTINGKMLNASYIIYEHGNPSRYVTQWNSSSTEALVQFVTCTMTNEGFTHTAKALLLSNIVVYYSIVFCICVIIITLLYTTVYKCNWKLATLSCSSQTKRYTHNKIYKPCTLAKHAPLCYDYEM